MPLQASLGYTFKAGEVITSFKSNIANSIADGQTYLFGVGSAGSPTVSFLGDTGTGFFSSSAGVVGLTGALAASGIVTASRLVSTVATGTTPLTVTSTTNVPNLNASSLGGATFAAPGSIGSGTASSGAFTSITGSSAVIGTGGVGVNTGTLVANGGSGVGGGSYYAFQRGGTTIGVIGTESAILGDNSSNYMLYSNAQPMVFWTNGALAMTIDTSQNVTHAAGIGFSPATTTTAPGAGGAGALPATPLGYATITIGGSARKFAYY